MLVRITKGLLSLIVALSMWGFKAEAEIFFDPTLKLDPTFSTPRTVMFPAPQYIYACNYIELVNELLRNWNNFPWVTSLYQKNRTTLTVTCDYLKLASGKEYSTFTGLNNLTPWINPVQAPATPLKENLNRTYNEVLVLYQGTYSDGGRYYVLISHQVIDGVIQTQVGYDYLSATFGG